MLGVVLPLLPTTPFILLAGACFAKSSPKFHHWLKTHKYFGPILQHYKSGQGIPVEVRNKALILIWISLAISMILLGQLWSTLTLSSLGLLLTIYMFKQTSHDINPSNKE